MKHKVPIKVPLFDVRRCRRCKGKRLLFGWQTPGDSTQSWYECPDCKGTGHVVVTGEPLPF